VSEFGVTVANLVHDGVSGPRNVLVKVYAPFDAKGKAVIDRILGSVKPIATATNTTPAATVPGDGPDDDRQPGTAPET
jgi:hypothetical protein